MVNWKEQQRARLVIANWKPADRRAAWARLERDLRRASAGTTSWVWCKLAKLFTLVRTLANSSNWENKCICFVRWGSWETARLPESQTFAMTTAARRADERGLLTRSQCLTAHKIWLQGVTKENGFLKDLVLPRQIAQYKWCGRHKTVPNQLYCSEKGKFWSLAVVRNRSVVYAI